MPDQVNVSDLKFVAVGNSPGTRITLREGDLRVELVSLKKGEKLPLHKHTDPKHEKLIVKGRLEVCDQDGDPIVLHERVMYMCGSGASYYHGRALEDTIIMVIESSDSTVIFPSTPRSS